MAAALVKLHLLHSHSPSGGAMLIKPRAETARGAGLFLGYVRKGAGVGWSGGLQHLVVGRDCTQPG